MASRRELILQDVVTALGGAGKPAGVTVHRARTMPLERDHLPAQVVYLISEEVTPGPRSYNPLARRRVTVRVESRVEVPAGTAPDAALDPLVSWAVQALIADPRRTALAHDTTETSNQWLAVDEDAILAACATDFVIDYVTSASDPDAAT